MRTCLAILTILLMGLSSSELLAQQRQSTFTTFTTREVTREEFASAIESNNRSLLNVDANQIVTAVNTAFNMDARNPADLAAFIRQMEVGLCPQERTSLARVHRTNRVIDLAGWERPIRPDEQCLYADNRAYFSLDCGNIIPNAYRIPGVTATVERDQVPDYFTRTETVYQPVYQPVPQVVMAPSRPFPWLPVGVLTGLTALAGVYCFTDWIATDACQNRQVTKVTIIR